MSRMSLWDYGEDVDLMADHIRASGIPRPLHLSLHLGRDRDNQERMYLVASWKWADNVLVAWAPAEQTIAEQDLQIASWSMKARTRALQTQGDIADYRCWPIPRDSHQWTVNDPVVAPPAWVTRQANVA